MFDPTSGTDLGSIDTNETVASLFGLTNAEFTVTSDTAAAGGSDSDLPTVGSVYDEFNLGNGYENIYTDIPGTAGGTDTVTDTLVTPFGNVNLDSLFGGIDAAAPAATRATPSPVSRQATAASAPTPSASAASPSTPPLRPEREGFDPVAPLATSPPLLEIGGGSLDRRHQLRYPKLRRLQRHWI